MAEWLGGIGNKAQLRPAKPEAGAWPELGKIKLLYPPIRVEWVGVRGWRGVEMIRIKAVLSSTGLELELSLAKVTFIPVPKHLKIFFGCNFGLGHSSTYFLKP